MITHEAGEGKGGVIFVLNVYTFCDKFDQPTAKIDNERRDAMSNKEEYAHILLVIVKFLLRSSLLPLSSPGLHLRCTLLSLPTCSLPFLLLLALRSSISPHSFRLCAFSLLVIHNCCFLTFLCRHNPYTANYPK